MVNTRKLKGIASPLAKSTVTNNLFPLLEVALFWSVNIQTQQNLILTTQFQCIKATICFHDNSHDKSTGTFSGDTF